MPGNNEMKITAEEVRKLPAGVTVTVHGRDRRGYSTELICEVVHTSTGRGRQLRYFDPGTRMVRRMPVKKLDGAVHYYTVASDWREWLEEDE